MKKILCVVLAVIIVCGIGLAIWQVVGNKDKTTNYSAEDIETNENLFAIGKTNPTFVVAEFNEDETKVVITQNGENSDGVITDSFSFLNSNLEEVYIGNGVENYTADLFYNCEALKVISVSNSNENYSQDDGVLFNKDKTTLIQYPIGKLKKEYTIPEGVVTIANSAFAHSHLESVVVPSSVSHISNNCFSDSNFLLSISLPNRTISIGNSAFNGCTRLASVTLPASITDIGINAFKECTSLKDVYYMGTENEWETFVKSLTTGFFLEELLSAKIHCK